MKDNKRVSKTKKKFEWTKKNKRILAISLLAGGLVSLVIFAVMVFVFDIGPVVAIKSSEEDSRIVGTVGEYEVKYQEIRYLAIATSLELDEKYGEYETLPKDRKALYDSELRELVEERVKGNYIILSLCEKYEIDPYSREVDKKVDESIKSFVDEIGGKKKYKEWLKENSITDEVVRFAYRVDHLETMLVAAMHNAGEFEYSEGNMKDFIRFVFEEESFIKVIHAYYPREMDYYEGFNDPTKLPRLRAESTIEKLLTCGNDDERYSVMKSAVGGAPMVQGYTVMNSTDYYITRGQMNEKYEVAAFDLELYENSEIIELDEGYYIIMRVPKSHDEISLIADELLVNYRYAALYAVRDQAGAEMSFVGNELYDGLVLAEIK